MPQKTERDHRRSSRRPRHNEYSSGSRFHQAQDNISESSESILRAGDGVTTFNPAKNYSYATETGESDLANPNPGQIIYVHDEIKHRVVSWHLVKDYKYKCQHMYDLNWELVDQNDRYKEMPDPNNYTKGLLVWAQNEIMTSWRGDGENSFRRTSKNHSFPKHLIYRGAPVSKRFDHRPNSQFTQNQAYQTQKYLLKNRQNPIRIRPNQNQSFDMRHLGANLPTVPHYASGAAEGPRGYISGNATAPIYYPQGRTTQPYMGNFGQQGTIHQQTQGFIRINDLSGTSVKVWEDEKFFSMHIDERGKSQKGARRSSAPKAAHTHTAKPQGFNKDGVYRQHKKDEYPSQEARVRATPSKFDTPRGIYTDPFDQSGETYSEASQGSDYSQQYLHSEHRTFFKTPAKTASSNRGLPDAQFTQAEWDEYNSHKKSDRKSSAQQREHIHDFCNTPPRRRRYSHAGSHANHESFRDAFTQHTTNRH